MTASDLTPITNRLDIQKSSQDTSVDKTRSKGRGIAKVPINIEFGDLIVYRSSFSPLVPTSADLLKLRGAILAQHNFELPANFRLLNPLFRYAQQLYSTVTLHTVTISSRTNSGAVQRYEIPLISEVAPTIQSNGLPGLAGLTPYERYTNQLLNKKAVIEFWAYTAFPVPNQIFYNAFYNLVGQTWQTNLLREPESLDELARVYTPTSTLIRGEMDVAYPEPLPATYPEESCWLTD